MNEKQRQAQQWIGCVLDGVFRLDQYLGEGEDGAVFQTDFSRRRAIIKVIPVDHVEDEAQIAAQLERWNASTRLNHPNLSRILGSGRSTVRNIPVLYIVTEYADETMAQVLAERVLTIAEARDVLATSLDTLAYLHSQGLEHGHIKASNFLAVGDKLKLSADGIEPSPDDARDVRMLGELFRDALAKPLPQPFLDITQHALDPQPNTRWTLQEIATRLDGRMPVREAPPKPPVWKYVLPVAAVLIAAIVFFIARSARQTQPATVAQSTGHPTPVPASTQSAAPAAAAPVPSQAEPQPVKPETAAERRRRLKAERRAAAKEAAAAKAAAAKSTPPAAPQEKAKEEQAKAEPNDTEKPKSLGPTEGILDRPLPNVPARAVRTIHGRVLVPIHVDVDPAGNVTDAKVDGRSGSRYFASFALKAARQWKFAPSPAPQSWLLRFEFTRQDTKVSSARVHP